MLRLAAVFIAVCMVLIAGSLAAVCYFFFKLSSAESAVIGLAALTGLALYNTVAARLRDRSDIGDQIADLSRLTADLSKHMAETRRNLSAAENKVDNAVTRLRAAIDPVTSEIGELGNLVKQLAETVAQHETVLARGLTAAPASLAEAMFAPAAATAADEPLPVPVTSFDAVSADAMVATIREAIDANRMDLYLQPIVTLPQRKVRYYEALSRLRTASAEQVMAEDFVLHAEAAGLMPKIDNLLVFRCVQILRRLLMKNREVGLFCNLAAATLSDPKVFPPFLDFVDANRALAPALVFEFKQEAYRGMGQPEFESLGALSKRGFRFSMDRVTDLRLEPRELSDRGFRFVKVSGPMLLRSSGAGHGDINPADLSDLLARYHIDLIAERIENESSVVDLLDYDVRFGQGFLFSQPRPVRTEAMAANGNVSSGDGSGDGSGGSGGNGEPAKQPAEARPAPIPNISDPAAAQLSGGLRVMA